MRIPAAMTRGRATLPEEVRVKVRGLRGRDNNMILLKRGCCCAERTARQHFFGQKLLSHIYYISVTFPSQTTVIVWS